MSAAEIQPEALRLHLRCYRSRCLYCNNYLWTVSRQPYEPFHVSIKRAVGATELLVFYLCCLAWVISSCFELPILQRDPIVDSVGTIGCELRTIYCSSSLVTFGASIPSEIRRGQIWRLVCPVFLHLNIFHLLVGSKKACISAPVALRFSFVLNKCRAHTT